MKRLEDLPLLSRIMLAIAIVIAVLLIVLIASRFMGEGDASAQTKTQPKKDYPNFQVLTQENICVDHPEIVERAKKIMLEALDEGLKQQIVHLFEVWVRDFKLYNEGMAPARQGARHAVIAYDRSRAALEKWNPQLCKEQPK